MRIKKKLFILCLLLIGFTSSCDIPGTIELKTECTINTMKKT